MGSPGAQCLIKPGAWLATLGSESASIAAHVDLFLLPVLEPLVDDRGIDRQGNAVQINDLPIDNQLNVGCVHPAVYCVGYARDWGFRSGRIRCLTQRMRHALRVLEKRPGTEMALRFGSSFVWIPSWIVRRFRSRTSFSLSWKHIHGERPFGPRGRLGATSKQGLASRHRQSGDSAKTTNQGRLLTKRLEISARFGEC